GAHVLSPDVKHRAHEVPAPRGHAAKAREATAAKHVEDDALDEVVGGVGAGDHSGACGESRALEERIAQLAGGGLERSPAKWLGPPFGDHLDPEPRAAIARVSRHR